MIEIGLAATLLCSASTNREEEGVANRIETLLGFSMQIP
jgi:hypothetical protein